MQISWLMTQRKRERERKREIEREGKGGSEIRIRQITKIMFSISTP